jgi:membrane protein DedA with SNARE-associated domain
MVFLRHGIGSEQGGLGRSRLRMEELIKHYGYLILFIGTFAEGETILVMAGFLAHRGYLELPWVIVTAFFGTLAVDQLFYYVGYLKGLPFLKRRPRWEAKYGRALALFSQYQTLIILCFRFLYGFRTITPFVIGLSKVSPIRFLFLNAVGAFMWALVVGLLGYSLGLVLEAYVERIERYEMWIMGAIVTLGLLVWIIYWRWNRRSKDH